MVRVLGLRPRAAARSIAASSSVRTSHDFKFGIGSTDRSDTSCPTSHSGRARTSAWAVQPGASGRAARRGESPVIRVSTFWLSRQCPRAIRLGVTRSQYTLA